MSNEAWSADRFLFCCHNGHYPVRGAKRDPVFSVHVMFCIFGQALPTFNNDFFTTVIIRINSTLSLSISLSKGFQKRFQIFPFNTVSYNSK